MKNSIALFAGVFVCIYTADAQDKKKEVKKWDFSYSISKNTFDSSLYKLKIDTMKLTDNSVYIPNAFDKTRQPLYTMPVKKLSGKRSVPMPGTERLDKNEMKAPVDSVRILQPLLKK